MKRFKKIPRSQSSIIVLDKSGIEQMMSCIPENCNVVVLDVKRSIPYILEFKFFINFVRIFTKTKDLYLSLLSAIIRSIDPKIVMTFIDNNPKFGELSHLNPSRRMISIQNGVRSSSHLDIGKWGKGMRVANYYSFGDYEKDMFLSKDVIIESIRPVGSIRMSNFLSNNPPSLKDRVKKRQVCFISQFRVGMIYSKDELLAGLLKTLKTLSNNLIHWGYKNKIKIVIVLFYNRGEKGSKEEVEFYQSGVSQQTDVEFMLNDRDKMLSYKVCMESEAIVALDSTLGYELFGCGSKLLFCLGRDQGFLEKWGGKGNLNKMPELVLLNNKSVAHFNEKMNRLFFIKHNEYLTITEKARKYYMKCNTKPAHLIIKDDIGQILKSVN